MNTLLRIKAYLDYKGISNQKFEKSIGLSNGAFGHQLKNNRTIGVDKLEKVLAVYQDVSPAWLLTGEGEMIQTKNEAASSAASLNIVEITTQLRQEHLSYESRLQLADEILAKVVDLTDENSRLKSELLAALRIVHQL